MEEKLLEYIMINDREAVIEQLMEVHGQNLLHLVYSYVRNKELAQDLTQEIFVKCYQKLDQYNQKSSLKTWLWRIAINHCKDYLKSWHYRHIVVSEAKAMEGRSQKEAVENQVIQKYEDEQLSYAVMQLPDTYREVIYLYYFEDLSIKEISYLTKNNQNTIKTRLKRAKQLLKESLEAKSHG
ncbi:sigma-70 family RNA polymerase sigma factor [Neobacillus muris]|uniref:sigma-70 family RNA polymerase sigma factor n=1 Tax=Neobacillus muris TaxID=2941334 RepID=UPI0024079481|nr:sigma-70 family RNA polymerase sigma factor [Neobacillus muris]